MSINWTELENTVESLPIIGNGKKFHKDNSKTYKETALSIADKLHLEPALAKQFENAVKDYYEHSNIGYKLSTEMQLRNDAYWARHELRFLVGIWKDYYPKYSLALEEKG